MLWGCFKPAGAFANWQCASISTFSTLSSLSAYHNHIPQLTSTELIPEAVVKKVNLQWQDLLVDSSNQNPARYSMQLTFSKMK